MRAFSVVPSSDGDSRDSSFNVSSHLKSSSACSPRSRDLVCLPITLVEIYPVSLQYWVSMDKQDFHPISKYYPNLFRTCVMSWSETSLKSRPVVTESSYSTFAISSSVNFVHAVSRDWYSRRIRLDDLSILFGTDKYDLNRCPEELFTTKQSERRK